MSSDDLPDIDIDKLLNETNDNDEPDIGQMSKAELRDYVRRRGSVDLGNGRLLISCPKAGVGMRKYSKGASNKAICGLYPVPDPNGGGSKIVCTGPLFDRQTGAGGCAYDPHRLEE